MINVVLKNADIEYVGFQNPDIKTLQERHSVDTN